MLMVCRALRGSRHQPQQLFVTPASQQNYVDTTHTTFNGSLVGLQSSPWKRETVRSPSPPHCRT